MAFFAGASLGKAQGITWTGSLSTAWSTAGNWSPTTVPGPSDIVVFNSTPTNQPSLASAYTVSQITVNAGDNIGLFNGGSGGITITTGGITLGSGSALTFALPTIFSGGLTIQGPSGVIVTSTAALSDGGSGFSVTGGVDVRILASNNVTGSIGLSNGSIIRFIGQSAVANSVSTNTSGDTVYFGDATGSGLTYTGTISGPGTVNFLDPSVVTGTDTYTGATNIGNGSFHPLLTLGNGSTSGNLSASSAIVDMGTLKFNEPSAFSFSNAISSTGGVIQSGPGTVILTGANTYSGPTFVSSGTMIVNNSSGSGTGTSTITVASGAVLAVGTGSTTGAITGSITDNGGVQFNRSNPYTYSGVISGSGTFGQDGSSTLTLGAANTYSGSTVVLTGILTDGIAGAFSPNSPIIIGSAGTLAVANNETVPGVGGLAGSVLTLGGTLTEVIPSGGTSANTLINGSGALTVSGTGALYLYGANTYSGATTINSGSVIALNGSGSATGTGTVTIASGALLGLGGGSGVGNISGNIVDNGTVQLAHTVSSTYGGSISGTGALISGGTQEFLTGASTYSGGTTVSSGTLVLTNTTGSGIGTGTATINGGATLQLGNATANGAITGNVVDNGSLTISRPDTIGYNGVISGTGQVNTIGGTLQLGGLNTYSGPTVLSGSIITDGATGAFSPNSVVTLTNSSSVYVNYNETIAGISGASGTGNLGSGATLTVNTSLGGGGFTGTLTGSGNLGIVGNGTQTLGGTNSYTGTTSIGSSATLDVITTLTGNVANTGTLQFFPASQQTYAGALSGSGTLSVSGTSTLTLTGANTYTGATFVNAGTLRVAALNSLPSASQVTVSTSATLDIGASDALSYLISSTGSFVLVENGATLTLAPTLTNIIENGGLSGPGALLVGGTSPNAVIIGAGDSLLGGTTINSGGTLQIGAGITTNGFIAGNIVDGGTLRFFDGNVTSGGIISGTGALVQGITSQSAGITTITGANTYSGGTTVNSGTLLLGNSSGSATGTGGVTVASGGTLAGQGSASGFLGVTSGGFVKPGSTAPGTLFVGSTTFYGGSAFVFDINNANGSAGTNWGLLSVTGGATISGSPFTIDLVSLTLSNTAGALTNFNQAQSYSWEIIGTTTGIGGFSPTLVPVNTSAFVGTFNGSFSTAVSGTNLFVNYTPAAVPEPGTWALMAGGLLALAAAAPGTRGWRRRPAPGRLG